MFRIVSMLMLVAYLGVGCVPDKPQSKKTAPPPEPTQTNPHVTSGGGLDLDGLLANLPAGWTRSAPSSSMRLAEVALKAADGDTTDAQLAVFHFPGSGGDSKSNLERWQSQIEGPNGEPGKSVAKTDTIRSNGITIITTDITGTLLPSSMGMGPTTKSPNSRMIASVLETPGGNWFIKIAGPKKTVGTHEDKIRAFLKTAKISSSGTM